MLGLVPQYVQEASVSWCLSHTQALVLCHKTTLDNTGQHKQHSEAWYLRDGLQNNSYLQLAQPRAERQQRAVHTQPRVALKHSKGPHALYAAFDATLAEATARLLEQEGQGSRGRGCLTSSSWSCAVVRAWRVWWWRAKRPLLLLWGVRERDPRDTEPREREPALSGPAVAGAWGTAPAWEDEVVVLPLLPPRVQRPVVSRGTSWGG